MIKALFCDFYGTVVFEDDEPIHAITARIFETGNADSEKEIGAFWSDRFFSLCAEAHGKCFRTQRDLELLSLRETLERFGSPEDAERLSKPQFDYWQRPPLFDDAKTFFVRCPVPVYIVSNIDTADLQCALDFHGLRPAGIVTSEQAQAYKPRAEMFEYALRKFGLQRNEVLHIGDSFGSDILGAENAGIEAVWINRKGRTPPRGAFRQTNGLTEIIDIINEHVIGEP